MMTINRSALVAGATGLVGQELVRQLLAGGSCGKVIALVRRELAIEHPSLVQLRVDYERLEESAAGIDMKEADVYCALGTTIRTAGSQAAFRKVDYDYPLELGRLAKRQGAGQLLVVSSMGADARSRIFYSRVKGELEEALRGLGLPTLSLFRPSLLLGERAEFRLGERVGAVLSRGLSFAMAGPLARYKPIHARDVAAGMIAAARKAQPGCTVYLSDAIAELARR
ncbi:oxidoreductase [Paenibacillus chartarius]|uniref:Oxidoreductase n=1 Tax=Paenibacillus chartarius TaxID=747481 RepID=A0ABV6DM60_9BACL